MKPINTLQQAIQHFSDEQVCIDTVAALRWPEGVICPACGHKEHYYLKTQKRWKCKDCNRQFSVKLGTIFEDSAIPLNKWLVALWMLTSCRNGVSSYEVHRAVGITQKSAWFVLHRLRLALQGSGIVKIGGPNSEVEVDETFIGGKAREFELLKYFLCHPGETLSRDRLLEEVWGYDHFPTTRTVDAHIVRLRQKLEARPEEPRFILTVHGTGYKFVG